MGFYKYDIQMITSLVAGDNITAAGGKVIVCVAGSPDKVALYDAKLESAIANPLTPVRGKISFKTQDTIPSVDLYIQAPGGQFTILRSVVPSGPNEVAIPSSLGLHRYVIPFSITDTTANTETRSGIVIPTNGAVQPGPLVRVTTADATQTIDVGTLSTDSGDADGFIDGLLLTNTGLQKPTLATAGITLGVLLWAQDSANAGDEAPEQNVSMAGKEITYTLNAGTDTAKGFVTLPVVLAA